ncbi:centromere kinetochore component CENP-T-domain-containing protein [Xylariomycetidae sp. FL2044]|nr:centromere kinetochore component CENP-T-domain-containing protein [Xylariomycetidae sp. FL2044]
MASTNNHNPASARGNNRLAPLSTPRDLATPNRRAISAEPTSGRLSASARRTTVATPHARAAIRALDQRRAALFTPGRARRRSLREQRETPRDLLRNLSRVLAPTTAPLSSSSSPEKGPHGGGGGDTTALSMLEEGDELDDDDDFPIERPRFSLPLAEDDDDDSELKPPRSSGLEDENFTLQSIELPRRAISEGPLSRLSRGSLGSVRLSDYAGPDFQSDDVGIDSGFFPPPMLDESGEMLMDEQAIVERLDAEETRRQTLGRESGFGPIELPDIAENETTFMMAPVESPVRDEVAAGGMEDDDSDGAVGFGFEDADMDADMDVDDPTGAPELQNENEELDETLMTRTQPLDSRRIRTKKAGKKISSHGIEYPQLPTNVVKRLATTFAKTAGVNKAKISPDTLNTIMQATDWFFEQLGDDLSAYAKHAGRKTIDESDMVTLMRRQRQTNASTTPFALASRHLPRELIQELRMPVPTPSKASRKKSKVAAGAGDEGEEVT